MADSSNSQSSSTILRGLGHSLSNIERQDERSQRFDEIEKHRAEILRKAQHSSGAADENDTIPLLAHFIDNLSSQNQTVSKCQRILNTLSFEEISWRQDSIAPARASTFDWTFKNTKLGFAEWAENNDGE